MYFFYQNDLDATVAAALIHLEEGCDDDKFITGFREKEFPWEDVEKEDVYMINVSLSVDGMARLQDICHSVVWLSNDRTINFDAFEEEREPSSYHHDTHSSIIDLAWSYVYGGDYEKVPFISLIEDSYTRPGIERALDEKYEKVTPGNDDLWRKLLSVHEDDVEVQREAIQELIEYANRFRLHDLEKIIAEYKVSVRLKDAGQRDAVVGLTVKSIEYAEQQKDSTSRATLVQVQELREICVIDTEYSASADELECMCIHELEDGDGCDHWTEDGYCPSQCEYSELITTAFVWYPVEVFLTKGAAERFIKSASYKYTGKLRVYEKFIDRHNYELRNLLSDLADLGKRG